LVFLQSGPAAQWLQELLANGADTAIEPRLSRCETSMSPQQQLDLAFEYARVVRDLEARRCLEMAAEAGLPRAQLELAMYHLRGKGGPGGALTVLAWLDRAAAGGNETAEKMRQVFGGNLENTSELKRSSKKRSEASRLTYCLLGVFAAFYVWLAIGNRSPWPWRWGTPPGSYHP
jgi:TPR repeat protein